MTLVEIFLPLLSLSLKHLAKMKGTKEFYEIVAQFERDFKNTESDLYISCVNPLARSSKESTHSFYENGMVNQIFKAYMMGYSFCKANN